MLTTTSFSQNIDIKQIDCSIISKTSSLYFVKYMNEFKTDSAKLLLNFWEEVCGMREPIFRAKILLALYTDEFNEDFFTEMSLNYFFNYQSRMDVIKSTNYYLYDNYKSYYGYVPLGEVFDNFTRKLAFELKTYYHPESLEYILAEFYSDNYEVIFLKIQSKSLENSVFFKRYYDFLSEYKNLTEFHFSFLAGIWIPTGELSKIGAHPELGFQLGWKKKRLNFDFMAALKFVNTSKEYYARRTKWNEEWELTNLFFGWYFGFEFGGDLFSRKGHEIQATGGIAYDGFRVLKEDLVKDLNTATISSFNLNFGVSYRYYITSNFYLGLKVKYHLVDYSLNKVIDFTGNPITIHFTAGVVKNAYKDSNLKALKYKLRK